MGCSGHYCKAATAMILLRESTGDKNALTLLKAFADNLRVLGRTAYLSTDGSAYALDMGTQAMVARACVFAGTANSPIPMLLLNKLANYVAQGGSGRRSWSSGGSTGVARTVVRYP